VDPVLEILDRRLDSDSETTYPLVVKALRNVVVPLHSHGYVQTFSSDLTTKGKDGFAAVRPTLPVRLLNMLCSTQLVPSWVGIYKVR